MKPLVALLIFGFLTACSTAPASIEKKAYLQFAAQKKYPKTFKVYQDKALLKEATKENSKVTVHLATQRLRLMVNGQTALDTPTTTGSSRKRDRNTGEVKNKATPKGAFPIRGKLKEKRSSIFGRLYLNNKLVYSGDKRKYKGKYDDYKGAPINYWLRLTNDGIGIHASSGIRRRPSSNGCIRVPHKVAPKLFSSVGRGTLVVIK